MAPVRTLLLTLALLLVALAGCFGGDDEPAPGGEDEQEEEQEGTGSVAGRVFNLDGLEPIQGALVRLVTTESEEAANATTDEAGEYTIRNVAPGTYRVQAAAACCRESIDTARVKEDQRVWMNFTLERYEELRDETPYVDVDGEWDGLISCAVATSETNPMFPGPCLADENHNHRKIVFFPPGVRSITLEITWDPAGGGLGADEMRFSIANLNAGLLELGTVEGSSPLTLQVQDLDFEEPDDRFSAFDADGWVARLQMEPVSGAANLVYQQAFSVRYHTHFWDPAPETYTLADGGGSAEGTAPSQPGDWIHVDPKDLLTAQAQDEHGPNDYQEGPNGDCLDYNGLYDVDGVHGPLAVTVDVDAGTGFVTDSTAGWAHIDFHDSDGNWLGWNNLAPNGDVPEEAEYGIMCIGLRAAYPDAPEPFANWFYMDGFTPFSSD